MARLPSPRQLPRAKTSSKLQVLVISLEKEDSTEAKYEQLYRALRKNVGATEVRHARTAKKALAHPARWFAILVTDAAITLQKNAPLLTRLIDYACDGERVVLGMQFSSHFQPDTVAPFFRKWGLEWHAGSCVRTTFGLNFAGVPAPLDPNMLFPSVSMKALHLTKPSPECAVYFPTNTGFLESIGYDPTPLTGYRVDESPAVFARVGDGYLGYVGDVNGEQASIRLTLEMCGVKVQPGDLGSVERLIGVVVHPDWTVEPAKEREEEIPLPAPAVAPTAASVAAAILRSPPETTSESDSDAGSTPSSTTLSSSAPVFVPAHARSHERPREAEVIARAAQRAKVRAENAAFADAQKEQGDFLLGGTESQWVRAAEYYRAAALTVGPRDPVYLVSLAGALLKLKLWKMAESAASRVLLLEPDHEKARLHRAQARKEQHRFKAAQADLQRILANDASSASALAELDAITALQRTARSAGRDLSEDDEPYEDVPDLEEESDSEDCTHEGNGIPCRFYNRSGCIYGARCRFSHAPDKRSVRDELGRNVCVYWLLDECRLGAEQCVYAHDRTYLPTGGQWWEDAARNARVRAGMHAMCAAVPSSYWEVLLAEAAKPDPWRLDLWATGKYVLPAVEAGEKKAAAGGAKNGKKAKNGRYAGTRRTRRDGNYRDMDDFYEEMMMQGIKPWDENYSYLYRALRKNAVVTQVCHARSANKALSSAALPSAILVSDAALTRPKHAALLVRLVAYARGGGRVVLGVQLSSHFQMGLIGPFFRAWGLAWDWGSLHRTTFSLNPAGVPAPLDPSTLFPACSMQALHVKNVPRVCAVYLPTAASRLESVAYYAPASAAGDKGEETPAAFARVGDGYVGYVGDVNGEQGSIRLTLEMLTGVVLEIHPDGSTVDEKRRDEEIPLPPPALPWTSASASASASVASAILKSPPTFAAGSRSAGKSALSSSAPVFVPTKRWTLGRPREAEVIARAAQRAQVRAAKTARADALKEEGNALFRRGQASEWAQAAEKYRAAAFAAGHDQADELAAIHGGRPAPLDICCGHEPPPDSRKIFPQAAIPSRPPRKRGDAEPSARTFAAAYVIACSLDVGTLLLVRVAGMTSSGRRVD
ncbi:hypothetical protein VTO73DRAFT_6283 [Trametes versicolor]